MRYRDYFVIIPDPPHKVNGYTVERIEQTLSEISGMELTVEGSGGALDFLECTLSLRDGTPSVPMKRPVFHGYARMSSPPSRAKLLDVFSPNTPRMLRSLVPNLVKKAAPYRPPATGTSFANNVSIVARAFLTKGCPVRWWKPCLFRKASSLDLLGPARAGVQTAMSSSQPTVYNGSTMYALLQSNESHCVCGCLVTNGVNDGVFHRCSQLCSPRSHPSLFKNA